MKKIYTPVSTLLYFQRFVWKYSGSKDFLKYISRHLKVDLMTRHPWTTCYKVFFILSKSNLKLFNL